MLFADCVLNWGSSLMLSEIGKALISDSSPPTDPRSHISGFGFTSFRSGLKCG